MQQYWKSPSGKMIPFEEERVQVFVSNDDHHSWFIEVAKFPKNTNVNIVSYSGVDSFGDGEPTEIETHVRRWLKMPHEEYKKNKDKILTEGRQIIARLAGDEI